MSSAVLSGPARAEAVAALANTTICVLGGEHVDAVGALLAGGAEQSVAGQLRLVDLTGGGKCETVVVPTGWYV